MKRQLANTFNCRHARMTLLFRGGCANQQIFECCGCTPARVRRIIRRFNRSGIEDAAV